LTLRFLLDEDLSQRVAEGLRRRGVDALSVHELGRRTLADEAQLVFATMQGRTVVTYNRRDFQALDDAWRLAERRHAGILWANERSVPRGSIGELIRALQAAFHQYESLAGLCLPLSRSQDAT
jgi:predicted nuclease of predicted toxin-antitoxin system